MSIKTSFSPETKLTAFNLYNGYCCVTGCYHLASEAHHALPNTVPNNKNYPLLVQSIINCKPVCIKHHGYHSLYPELTISDGQAQVYEEYLRELKDNKGE